MTATQILTLVAAAFGGGAMNAMAGGGTILTFPTLVFLGMPAIEANATSTVALLPGAMSSMAGYRQEVWQNRGWLKTLFLPSLIGGTVGSILLLRTPEQTFQMLAPILILFATVLFMLRGFLARRFAPSEGPSITKWVVAAVLQFGVAVYGGYFGAGIGILMLAALGFMGVGDIHRMNAVKTFLAATINTASVVEFVRVGLVDWHYAGVMALSAVAGGYAGARVALRLPQPVVRWTATAIGFGLALYYFVK
ncbi:MAG TPA: sulfite exporter TauE/SafE family protein [Thermoanaerobaculia bacterium]|nr:sulfite exporter TauE/SafE family protein [Thermoanaerobaculia bacterium]